MTLNYIMNHKIFKKEYSEDLAPFHNTSKAKEQQAAKLKKH
jgi:hypothetical protein